MPELPEVENLRIGLQKFIKGQSILSVKIYNPKIVSGKGTKRKPAKKQVLKFMQGVSGAKIIDIERRAKNLIFKLSDEKAILAHLKMTGQFVYLPARVKHSKAEKVIGGPNKNTKYGFAGGHPIEISEKVLPNKHSHLEFHLSSGVLYYNDVRKFGYVLYFENYQTLEKEKHFEGLGKEPLSPDFTLEYFKKALVKNKKKIKSVLLEQKIVVGIGNIYTDESLFEAKIKPDRPAKSLTQEETERLYKAIKRIMKKAILMGGSSVANYRLLDNTKGNYAREHKVYGKFGQNCHICKTKLKKMLINTRTTTFCSKCQK